MLRVALTALSLALMINTRRTFSRNPRQTCAQVLGDAQALHKHALCCSLLLPSMLCWQRSSRSNSPSTVISSCTQACSSMRDLLGSCDSWSRWDGRQQSFVPQRCDHSWPCTSISKRRRSRLKSCMTAETMTCLGGVCRRSHGRSLDRRLETP